jgi:CHAT domain-containing protein
LDSGAGADFFGADAVAFSPLPGSKQEVASVAGIVPEPSRLLVDATATEANFKALPLADFRVIHLAVHGVAGPQFPDRAALVLGNSKGSQDDGLLQAREIRDLAHRFHFFRQEDPVAVRTRSQAGYCYQLLCRLATRRRK